MINFRQAEFLKSAAKIEQLPPDYGAEVAFAGRSNAGKSSALNLLTGSKKLARVSKTPGRTQLLNFFRLDDKHRLVDLPGYGYAEAPKKQRYEWKRLIDDYLCTRQSLKLLVLLMDIRHPLKDFDEQLLLWTAEAELPVHILLSKADKLGRGAAGNTLQGVKKVVTRTKDLVSVQTFSSLKKTGLEELKAVLRERLMA